MGITMSVNNTPFISLICRKHSLNLKMIRVSPKYAAIDDDVLWHISLFNTFRSLFHTKKQISFSA